MRRAAAAREQIEAYVADTPPAERVLRFFDWVVELTQSPDFRGGEAVGDENQPVHLQLEQDFNLGTLLVEVAAASRPSASRTTPRATSG